MMRSLILLMLTALPATADCVVLLHGLARSSASLMPMQAALQEHGYQVVNEGYDSTSAPIAVLAAVVGAAVANAIRAG